MPSGIIEDNIQNLSNASAQGCKSLHFINKVIEYIVALQPSAHKQYFALCVILLSYSDLIPVATESSIKDDLRLFELMAPKMFNILEYLVLVRHMPLQHVFCLFFRRHINGNLTVFIYF